MSEPGCFTEVFRLSTWIDCPPSLETLETPLPGSISYASWTPLPPASPFPHFTITPSGSYTTLAASTPQTATTSSSHAPSTTISSGSSSFSSFVPEPSQSSIHSGLSEGAKTGLGAGLFVGLSVVAGVVLFLWSYFRPSRHQNGIDNESGHDHGIYGYKPELDGNAVTELSGKSAAALETQGHPQGHLQELPAEDVKRQKQQQLYVGEGQTSSSAQGHLQELPAEDINKQKQQQLHVSEGQTSSSASPETELTEGGPAQDSTMNPASMSAVQLTRTHRTYNTLDDLLLTENPWTQDDG